MADVKVTKDLENNTLAIECVVNASKTKVWRAYTEKDWFEKWWGPEGWETTTKQFDFRPGGRVHYCMRCVDEVQEEWFGQESWGMTTINEVNEPNSYAATDHFSDADGNVDNSMPGMRLEVEFIDEAGKTKVVNRAITETVEQLEQLLKMGMVKGFSSQLNRLERLLAE